MNVKDEVEVKKEEVVPPALPEEEPQKTDAEIIEELTKKNRDLILLVKRQKENLHHASMKINKMERDIFMAQNQVDSIGGMLIAIVNRYGTDGRIELLKEDVELVPPGTMIEDEETPDKLFLKVVDVSQQPRIIRGPGGQPMMIGPNGQPIPLRMGPQGPMPVPVGPQPVSPLPEEAANDEAPESDSEQPEEPSDGEQ